MNMDLRPIFRAGVLALVALLAAGCSTAARQALMETRPVLEPTADARAALQGRAFRVGQVTIDIDVPEPKALHILPDDAYATMLKAKLEQAFAAREDRWVSDGVDAEPLNEGQRPAYTVDVVIKRMRFINWHELGAIDDAANLEVRTLVRDETGHTVASWPFRFGAGNTWGHTIEDPREAHGDLIPGGAATLTIALHLSRTGHLQSIDKLGPAVVNGTRNKHGFGMALMTRAETEALTGLHLDAIPLPSEAEMKAARKTDGIPLDMQRPERLTATVIH